LEEGWYYEGAGIHRHAWSTKTAPSHVGHWGTSVSTEPSADQSAAVVTARPTLANDGPAAAASPLEQTDLPPAGSTAATFSGAPATIDAGTQQEIVATMNVAQPQLWSIETPVIHRLITIVRNAAGVEVDRYETPFGIRSVRFDPDHGFFLNGQRVTLKGVNLHQDHAGVGVA
ncbi:hypothetical protein OY671_010544, partial [Metschnikowia pulcherrima]